MNHRERHAAACAEAFAGFRLDTTKTRRPDLIRRVRDLAAQGRYSQEIAEELGLSPKAVQKIFRRYSFPVLHNLEPPRQHERQGWLGGMKIVKGYLYQRTPGHPGASKFGDYVAVHRLVMERKIGRLLLPTEVVDHIDGDPSNNAPENLRVFASNAAHLRETLKGKCPQWSDEGKERIRDAVRKRHRLARENRAAASQKA